MRGITEIFISALLGSSAAITTKSTSTQQSQSLDGVSQVVGLLDTMLSQLVKEKDEDEATYQKLMCWIETNMAKNEDIITKTSAEVKALDAFLQEGTGQIKSLTQEKESLNQENHKKRMDLEESRAALTIQTQELNQSILQLKKNIQAVKGALVALGAGNAFNQKEVLAALTATENRHPDQSAQARNLFSSMLQTGADHFSSYTSSGGQIIGVLKALVDQMEADLADTQNQLSEVTAGGAKLVKNLSDEISAAKAAYDLKVAKLSDLNQEVSTKKVTKAATEKTLAAARDELSELQNKQEVTKATYVKRVADRRREMATISDTTKTLNSDQAFAARVKTQGSALPSDFFLQLRSVRRSTTPAQRAENLLRQVPSLSFLATQVHASGTGLQNVYTAMDQLIAELQNEQTTEVENRNTCIEQIAQSDASLDEVGATLSQTTANVKATTDRKSEATNLVQQSEADIASSKTSMQKLTDIRNLQNAEFIEAKRELHTTMGVLQKAIQRLSETYDNTDFIQQDKKEVDNIRFIQIKAHESPPPGLKTYVPQDVSGGPLSLLRNILGNFEKAMSDSVKEEQGLQLEYEASVKTANREVEALSATRNANLETVSSQTARLAELSADMDHFGAEKILLIEARKDIHDSCQTLISNFDFTQATRLQEIDAIQEAKAILSGKNFESASSAQQ